MKVVDSLGVKTSPKKTSPSLKNNKISKDVSQPVLVFFITFLIYTFLLFLNGLIPFGDTYLLLSDLKAQFAPYLILFKNHIKELDFSSFVSSFTYTSVLAGGKNFMATFGYYMCSPLNWLVFLFKDYQIDYAIVLIIGLKISFASSFMTMFLRKRAVNKNSNWPVLLGITYAFTSYALVYLFVIIWLDGYALLPLLLYFIEKLIDERKKSGIVATLLVLFVANLYVSYMVGVFSFFYLVARLIYKNKIEKSIEPKAALRIVGKFIAIAVSCIFALGVFIIPVGLGILSNRDVLTNTNKSSAVTFKGIEILDQFLLGNVGEFNTTFSSNLPFIFVSLLFTILLVVFFVSKTISKTQKYYFGTILALAYISFNIAFLDIAWQAFDKPNWFNHRFSFVFFPVFYVIALQVIEKIEEISVKDIVKSSAVVVAILILAQSFGKIAKDGTNFVLNLLFIVGYTLLLLAIKRDKWPEQLKNMKKLSAAILSLVLIVECSCINALFSDNISSYRSTGSSTNYENEAYLLQLSVGAVGDSCYRMGFEPGYYDPKVEMVAEEETPLIGNYRSINVFDSNSNKSYGRFLKQLGHLSSFNYFYGGYGYIAEPTDAFFSIPVVFKTSDDYSGKVLKDLSDGDSRLVTYFTGKVLPIGFAVDSKAMNFDFYQLERKELLKDYFKFQNDWYKSMFPESFTEDFYTSHRVMKDKEITLYNASYYPADKIGYSLDASYTIDPTSNDSSARPYQVRNTIARQDSALPIIVSINYDVTKTGEQYFSVVADRLLDEMTIYVNGKELTYISAESYYSRIIRLGYFEEGDQIEVVIKSNKDIFSYQDFYFATIDSEVFAEQLEKVDRNKVVVDKYENGNVMFTTNLSDGDMLLTSIPYEDGWTCYVDGVEKEITQYQDALIAVDAGSGTHKVELKFAAPGIKPGLVMSAVGVVMLIALFVVDNKTKKAKK
ncbi:MAG: YfhO family protein [Clostridia bacterium]|nr:YfhO family protein [Clostridia bacterium]